MYMCNTCTCVHMRMNGQVFYVIATVISVVALMLKARVFLQQLRERRSQLAEDALEDGQTERAKKLKKHRKRLVKTTRAILLTYSSLMVAVAECLPLGILQGVPLLCLYPHTFIVVTLVDEQTWVRSHVFTACGQDGQPHCDFSRHHVVVAVDRLRTCVMSKI